MPRKPTKIVLGESDEALRHRMELRQKHVKAQMRFRETNRKLSAYLKQTGNLGDHRKFGPEISQTLNQIRKEFQFHDAPAVHNWRSQRLAMLKG